MLPLGFGTQRLERALAELYPTARVLRVDRDSTRRKGAFATITAATRIETIGIRRYQLGELGLRAVMIDAEAVIALEPIRQSAVDTLGRELLLEKRFVARIGSVSRRNQLPAVTGLGIEKRIQGH
jgi:hypothetical protein